MRLKGELTFLQTNVKTLVSDELSQADDTNFSLSDEDEHQKKLNSGRGASGRIEQ